MEKSASCKPIFSQLIKKFSIFVERKISLPFSERLTAGPYPGQYSPVTIYPFCFFKIGINVNLHRLLLGPPRSHIHLGFFSY